jgi:O-antigen/teichoic acid export membrane protein
MPSSTISSITNKVSFPVLSEMQNDDERLKNSIRKLITNVMYISFVIMFGLAAIARPLFEVLLGSKWLPAVIMFQALCIAYAISPMHVINHNIIKIKGRSDLFLKTEILKYLIFTPLLILGAIYGITVLIGGIVLFYWIGFIVNALYSKRLIDYSIFEQTIDFLPVMGIAVIPALMTWSLEYLLSLSNIILLSVQLIFYPSLVVFLSVLFKMPAFYEIKQILTDKFTFANLRKTLNNK